MATMQATLKAVLTGDATLMALATGGVYDGDSVGRRGLTRETLATAGQVAIDPAIYINWVTDTPYGVRQEVLQARRVFAEIYFYQDTGYATVRAMRQRVRELLEYEPVQYDDPASERMRDIFWRGDIVERKDESLSDVSMEQSQYEILITPAGG